MQLSLKEGRSFSLRGIARFCHKNFISYRGEEKPNASRYEYKFIVFLWRMTNLPLYRAFFIFIIFFNVGVLSSDYAHD